MLMMIVFLRFLASASNVCNTKCGLRSIQLRTQHERCQQIMVALPTLLSTETVNHVRFTCHDQIHSSVRTLHHMLGKIPILNVCDEILTR